MIPTLRANSIPTWFISSCQSGGVTFSNDRSLSRRRSQRRSIRVGRRWSNEHFTPCIFNYLLLAGAEIEQREFSLLFVRPWRFPGTPVRPCITYFIRVEPVSGVSLSRTRTRGVLSSVCTTRRTGFSLFSTSRYAVGRHISISSRVCVL